MRIFFFIFLFSFLGCINKASKNQIDNKLLDLIIEDLSYEQPRKLQTLIQSQPDLGKSIEKEYNYFALNKQFRLIQKRLNEKQKSPTEVKSNLNSFYNRIDTLLRKNKTTVLDELFETINLQDDIKNLMDTSDYDIIRFKTALFFHYTTQYINSRYVYHPTYDCENPSVFTTDTIKENDPVTFFFGHVYADKNTTIFIEKINDKDVSISFPSDSDVGISSIIIKQLQPGSNKISGRLYASSQKNPKYDFISPFERIIYVD